MLFKRNAKKFYQEIGKETLNVDDALSIEDSMVFGRVYGAKKKD